MINPGPIIERYVFFEGPPFEGVLDKKNIKA
jgi:hypothetical protein